MRDVTPKHSRSALANWLFDIFKIACGAALGYLFLLVGVLIFWDVVIPLIRAVAIAIFAVEL